MHFALSLYIYGKLFFQIARPMDPPELPWWTIDCQTAIRKVKI